MNNFVLESIIAPFFLNFIDQLINEENYQVYGDKLLDFCEEMISSSKTTLDDKTLLPVIAKIRELANIPDLPDDEKAE